MSSADKPAPSIQQRYEQQVQADLQALTEKLRGVDEELRALNARREEILAEQRFLEGLQTSFTGGEAASPLQAAPPAAAPTEDAKEQEATGTHPVAEGPAVPKTRSSTEARRPKTGAARTGSKNSTRKGRPPGKPAGSPTWLELIRALLSEHPRSSGEIHQMLKEEHPTLSAKVTRLSLERLVARSQADRLVQGRSVHYTAPEQAADEPADPSASAEAPDDTDTQITAA